MARMLLAYSTVDGHTLTICQRLQQRLEQEGHAVTIAPLSTGAAPDPLGFDAVVIGASIRYGKYRQEVFGFIERHRELLEARPSAFFTVNVVARKPGKDTPATNPYLRTFRRKTTWQPALLGVVAGRIDYRRYGFLDRNIIRFIMWLTHGPTDPHACVEFTDWQRVDAFAREVSALTRTAASAPVETLRSG